MNLLSAFKHANDVLFGAVKGITDLILLDGLMNVDFADVKTVMAEMGMAMMGSSEFTRKTEQSLPRGRQGVLYWRMRIQGARGILVNITSGHDLTLGEFQEVGNIIREFADEDATIIVGSVFDTEYEGTLRVTVVATGLVSSSTKSVSRPIKDSHTSRKPGEINWKALEKQTRARRAEFSAVANNAVDQTDIELSMIILMFQLLRRQAD